jgi:hypothetical protein
MKKMPSFVVSLQVESIDYGREDREPGEAFCIGESKGIVYADFQNNKNFEDMFCVSNSEGTTVTEGIATTFNRLQGWKDSVGDEYYGKLGNYVIKVVERDIPEKSRNDLGVQVNVKFWRNKYGQQCTKIYTQKVTNKKVTNKKSPTNPLACNPLAVKRGKRAISKK